MPLQGKSEKNQVLSIFGGQADGNEQVEQDRKLEDSSSPLPSFKALEASVPQHPMQRLSYLGDIAGRYLEAC
jgi:hypothetical protein